MPYRSEHMTFGVAKSLIDEEKNKAYVEDLMLALDLKRQPVGIKLLTNQDEYQEIEADEPRKKMAYCQMIASSSSGKVLKSTLANQLCDGATTALGMEASNPKIDSGDEYFSYNLFESKTSARRLLTNIERFDKNKVETYGVLTAPLTRLSTQPSVVQLIVSPFQAMRLVQGYEYKTGIKPKVDLGAMQAFCSELTVVPMLTGEMNVSVLCPSTRMLCGWKEEDMAVSIPFERFYETVDGVFGTMSTTESKKKKYQILERFEKAGKPLDLDPELGY